MGYYDDDSDGGYGGGRSYGGAGGSSSYNRPSNSYNQTTSSILKKPSRNVRVSLKHFINKFIRSATRQDNDLSKRLTVAYLLRALKTRSSFCWKRINK